MDWPANSPDLNPIENLWDILKRRLQSRPQAPDLQTLGGNLREKWNAFSQEIIRSLIQSMANRQCNSTPNIFGNYLDLVLSDLPCVVSKAEPLLPEDAYHPTLDITCNIDTQLHSNLSSGKSLKAYNFRRADYPLLYDRFFNTAWSFLETGHFDNINDMDFSSWFTRDIINNLKEKYRQFRIYKCTNSVIALESFKRLRALTKKQIKEAYSTYEQTIQNNLQTQPQDLWKFVNQKRKHSRIPGIMEYENTQLSDTSQILDAFGSFFRSVYEQKQDNWDGCPVQLPLNCVSLIGLDESDVLNALRKLKAKVTAGPDSVPSFIVRDCAAVFSKALTKIFNLALRTNTFPDAWKNVKICPVFKSGNVNGTGNYRPIAILSNFAKAFEMYIFTKLFP
ncbi:uncharacterized protein LOC115890839 [Sitophilus oryzae]|uniref:Uncharacterized protein LOC115890839 n=1 Tax=Sitophilus oryzae TaxID=7048 RepID=A0A6J2YUT1_SITOR|nr:uncharacterized protein LOC115890839 [Sitophilus oryzae]